MLFSPDIPFNSSICSGLYPLDISMVDIDDVYSSTINWSLSPNWIIWVL
jgi:hypothetical protein